MNIIVKTHTDKTWIKLGENIGMLSIPSESTIEEVSIDVSLFDSSKICIVQKISGKTAVNIYDLDKYTNQNIVTLLFCIIQHGKPKKVNIDTEGVSRGVFNRLTPLLLAIECVIASDGQVHYGAEKIFELIRRGENK